MPFNHNQNLNTNSNNSSNKYHIQSPSISSSVQQSPAAAKLAGDQLPNGLTIESASSGTNQLASFPNISSNYLTQQPPPQSSYSEDANKAFDDVVFDILKVEPDHIAGQLTLIDIPLFKLIEPDELISCKWMSREKLVKAPNIVQFTRRFNQTAFWCQKEILNCKRIETRGKMITHFIKIAKRLNELHSFNSLMAIIVALKAAPIYRLKKTWSQHVSKRDLAYFDKMADIMFDTSDNKRKIRDMHMNCKLPCIPFLGLFLTDLIHIDIAHPHNAFDNPQRRNQMNNICRLISEYQQSNYQDLTSLSCICLFSDNHHSNGMQSLNDSDCVQVNCGCDIHHGHGYGAGIINNDGTIYISEVSYVKNYLNSFLYIEELQKFKEDDNYRESLELEPDPVNINNNNSHNGHNSNNNHNNINNNSDTGTKLAPDSSNLNNHNTSSPCKLINCAKFGVNISNNNNHNNNGTNEYSIESNLVNETKVLINELKLSQHPLDDSIYPNQPQPNTSILPNGNNLISKTSGGALHITGSKSNLDSIGATNPPNNQNNTNNNGKANDLLKAVLKQRHQSISTNGCCVNTTGNEIPTLAKPHHHHHNQHHHSSIKHKFNCISSNTTEDDDLDDDEDQQNVNNDNETSLSNQNNHHTPTILDSVSNKAPNSAKSMKNRKNLINSDNNNNNRRLSGRNLANSFNIIESNDQHQQLDFTDSKKGNGNGVTPNISSSDLCRFSLIGDVDQQRHPTEQSSLSSVLYIDQHQLQHRMVIFESPVKRKCIIKSLRKPRFSQWKTYWLQLIGGNLLVYYPTKSVIASIAGAANQQRRSSTASQQSYFMQQQEQFQLDAEIRSVDMVSTNSADQMRCQQLHAQFKHQKVLFNKNPCKVHAIASWMVVSLFTDKEIELSQMETAQSVLTSNNSSNSNTSSSKYNKFDIQLNDLNNGNMYKYRFDSLHLAKEWYEQFKLASTYHERQKPDNLIRFD